jgi:3-(3-hydroxy-phenyl)propionate hydroxylase
MAVHPTYTHESFEFRPSPEQVTGRTGRYPVIVVGAGPIGLTAAVDLASRGISVVVLDENNKVCEGSRAICFAKRSLEIFDRLGVAGPMREKGVSWNVGRVFHREREVYTFDLLPEEGYAHPAFINLQQYYVEQYLVERLKTMPAADLRWLNRVVDMETSGHGVRITVETPAGPYRIEADYVIAADGAGSTVRRFMGLDWIGIAFRNKFLIADVVMQADFPSERWFWFDPPFNPGQSALLHRQPDNMWRLDFKLGPDADAEAAKEPENVARLVKAMLGREAEFEVEWVSVYSFDSRMLGQFRHGRVIFAGDAAHVMSVFGARGANSGIQDVDNVCWKLGLVLAGKAPPALLDSYSVERVYAARENLAITEATARFISPESGAAIALRNGVLELAGEHPFARPLVNSGRLSTATVLRDSPLSSPDEDPFEAPLQPGAVCADGPIVLDGNPSWFLGRLGNTFNGLLFTSAPDSIPTETLAHLEALKQGHIPVETIIVTEKAHPQAGPAGFQIVVDVQGLVRRRYDGRDGTFYLSRPDQHVCARWRTFDIDRVRAALARACCL